MAAEARTKGIAERLFSYRELLQLFPDMGRVYDPSYPAARPPFPCRVASVSDTPFDICYLKDEEARAVVIFSVQYKAPDPQSRLST